MLTDTVPKIKALEYKVRDLLLFNEILRKVAADFVQAELDRMSRR